MNLTSTRLGISRAPVLATVLAACCLTPVAAQVAIDEYDGQSAQSGYPPDYPEYEEVTADVALLTPDELDDLVGPIALYPDDLLAIVMPASTYPLDVIEAARFLEKHERDASLQPDERWDESVTALLNYPEVVTLMSEDVDWTWKLGGAVLNQQADVIEAVERFRDRAYVAGNLESDEYQTVRRDGDVIEIVPANKEVIYVPYYEPRQVVIRHVETVYHYYPRPYPVYYYPYPAGHSFYRNSFWGVSTAFRIGWSGNHLSVWHYTFRGHPYYGHHYSARYRKPNRDFYYTPYVRSSGRHVADRHRYGDRWRPRHGNGVRLGHRPRRAVHRDAGRPDGVAHNRPVRATQGSAARRSDSLERARAREDFSTRRLNRERSPEQDVSARDRNRQHRQAAGEGNARPARPGLGDRDTVTAGIRRGAPTGNVVADDTRRPAVRGSSTRSSRNPATQRTIAPRDTARTAQNRDTQNRRVSTGTHNRDTQNRRVSTETQSRDTQNRRVPTETQSRDTQNRRVPTETQNRDTQNRRVSTETQNRDTQNRRVSTGTRVTRTPSEVRRSDSAVRKPATPAKPPAARQAREPNNRAGREVKEDRQRRSEAKEHKESKESRSERKPARASRQQTRRH